MPNMTEIASVGINHYLFLSIFLFTLGMIGVLMRKNVIVILMCIELMLNGVNLAFLSFSHYLSDLNGQIMVFFVMVIAAAEAGVGLAIAVAIFKRFKAVDIKFFESLKG